ncbi:MAG: glucose-1-phosphate cytidylyltransferase [Hyphomicrobiales bacterium]|uniref:glucose-1-phosphate cytidylyltransferase n=1 Tax=Roseibium polysiphoniae TaxID=2571221 RepID=UPI0032981BBD
MKAVILAGGRGTRIAEEGNLRPKPMVTIGGMPILWHIMKTYEHYGVNDFIICLGYRGYVIKEYFANYALHAAEAVTFDGRSGEMTLHDDRFEPWRVTLVDTGIDTQTGGRIKRIGDWVKDEEMFCLTYGDGLINADIGKTIDFHKSHPGHATVTTVSPPGRFGVVHTDAENKVSSFSEKPATEGNRINGGFFVLSSQILDYIEEDTDIWEREPLESLTKEGQLHAYHHEGFWQPMDTMRERDMLQQMWDSGNAPWKVW